MTDLLQIGEITDVMRDQLAREVAIHRTDNYPADKITHIITTGADGVSPEILNDLPNLQAVSFCSVGYDAIDIGAAIAKGVVVSHTPNVLNAEVASKAVMLALMCHRNALHDDDWARSGRWLSTGFAPFSRTMENQTIGILGPGRIGQAIADKLAPWTPTIVYHTRTKKDVPYTYFDNLVDMATVCDVLICVTPGGKATDKIVNAEVINALGSQGTLINVSRGSVVDEPALISALMDKRLGWA